MDGWGRSSDVSPADSMHLGCHRLTETQVLGLAKDRSVSLELSYERKIESMEFNSIP
jgi:hypothetical protein